MDETPSHEIAGKPLMQPPALITALATGTLSPSASITNNQVVETMTPESENNDGGLPVLNGETSPIGDGYDFKSEIPDSEAASDWSSPVKRDSDKSLEGGSPHGAEDVGAEFGAKVHQDAENYVGGADGIIEQRDVASEEKGGEENHIEIEPESQKVSTPGGEEKPVVHKNPERTEDEIFVGETSISELQDFRLGGGPASAIKIEGVAPVIQSNSTATKDGGMEGETSIKEDAKYAPLPPRGQGAVGVRSDYTRMEDVQFTLMPNAENDITLIQTGDFSPILVESALESGDQRPGKTDLATAKGSAIPQEGKEPTENPPSTTSLPKLDEQMLDSLSAPAYQAAGTPCTLSQNEPIGDIKPSSEDQIQKAAQATAPELSQPYDTISIRQEPAQNGPARTRSSLPHRMPGSPQNYQSKEKPHPAITEASKVPLKWTNQNQQLKSMSTDIPSSPPTPVSKSPAPTKSPLSQNAIFSGPEGSQNKDVLMAELKSMKIASIQARNASLEAEIAKKRAKLEEVTNELSNPAAETVKKHIKLLHDYNDIRDVGQGLVGMIADNRGVRIGELYDEFGVGLKD